MLVSRLSRQHAAPGLIFPDRLEKRFEIALAETFTVLHWMNSKKIGPMTALENTCSRILVEPPSKTPPPSYFAPQRD
jgi:hypothetical protein